MSYKAPTTMPACQNSVIHLSFMEQGNKQKFIIFHFILHIAHVDTRDRKSCSLSQQPPAKTKLGFGLSTDFFYSVSKTLFSLRMEHVLSQPQCFLPQQLYCKVSSDLTVMTLHIYDYYHSPYQECMGYLNLVYMCFILCVDGQLNMHRKTAAPAFFDCFVLFIM